MNEWEWATYWSYEKLKEDGKIETVNTNKNDFDGSITGHIVFGVKEWFDEHPEERIRLGWVKHIHHNPEKYGIEYNKQSQYLEKTVKRLDAYTCEDVYEVKYKTEDMMRRAEESGYISNGWEGNGIIFYEGD